MNIQLIYTGTGLGAVLEGRVEDGHRRVECPVVTCTCLSCQNALLRILE